MNKLHYFSIIKSFTILGSFYLLVDGILHLLGIRVISVVSTLDHNVLSLFYFLNRSWGLIALFLAWVLVSIFSDEKKIRQNKKLVDALLWLSSTWIIILLPLLNAKINQDSNLPSLYFWIPFYSQLLMSEIVYLCIFVGLILYGKFKKHI